MTYKSITCSSVIIKITHKDTLFQGSYTLDPYQNCAFGCRYCDSSTDTTIYVKSNAVQLLQQEMSTLPRGRIIVGSVHDPYQPAEQQYHITRGILRVIQEHQFPCHILTKSPLVLRDIDILSNINSCHVTISIITLNDSIASLFEPEIMSSQERLQTVHTLTQQGITTGVAILPVLPYLVDHELETIVQVATEHQAQYVVHKYLELKGDQQHRFYTILQEHYPDLIEKYKTLYNERPIPQQRYIADLNKKMHSYYKKFNIPQLQ